MKQEAIYIGDISGDFQARHVIKNGMTIYNKDRPQTALNRLTLDNAYGAGKEKQKAA